MSRPDLFDTNRRTSAYDTLDHDVRKVRVNLTDAAARKVFYNIGTSDRAFQAELSAAVRATGSGCTGVTAIDHHSHFMNGTCDDETPYSSGGPA